MALGYEGAALIDGNLFLCTSMEVPEQEQRLDSGGAFGGGIPIAVGSNYGNAIESPHTYDYPENNGNASFDVNPPLVTFLKSWIGDRGSSKPIALYPNSSAAQTFAECFWSSISLSAAEGSAISGSLDFLTISRSSETIGDAYILDRLGMLQNGTLPGHTTNDLKSATIGALGGGNVQPIPFWKGVPISSELIPASTSVVSWTVTISQNLQRFFTCEAFGIPQAPRFLGVGAVTVEFQIELFINNTTYTLRDDVSSLSLDIGGETIGLSDLELQTHSQALRGQTDFTNLAMTYNAYGLNVA